MVKQASIPTENTFLADFLMGGTAAAISKTAAAPIERVKLLIQNQGAMIVAGRLNSPYHGIVDCFRRTYTEEGLVSFWRGNGTNVIRYFPTQALNFAFKDEFKKRLGYKKSDGFGLWVFGNVASGAAAGATSSLFVYSLDYARTRLSADAKDAVKGGERQFNGLIDVYRKTLLSDGILGLYRGFVPSVLGIIVYRGLYFGGYDTVRDTVLVGPLKGNFLASFAVGWVCTTVKYKSFIDAGRQITAKEGVKALFNGAGANILRGVASAGVLALYDKSRKRQRLQLQDLLQNDVGTEPLTGDPAQLYVLQPLYDEVDLEIAVRERLLSTIEGRIQWATLLLSSLQHPHELQALPQSSDVDEFQDAALDALEALEAPSAFLFETATTEDPDATPRSFSPLLSIPQQAQRSVKTRPSRAPKISQPKKLLYIRLSPGTEANKLAVLTCPACGRTQFSTLQGLLNHARLAHGIEWASHDACITACAVLVTSDDDIYKTYEQDGVEVPWGGNVVGLRRLFERAVGVESDFIAPLPHVAPPDVTQDSAIVPSTLLSRTLGLHADSPSLALFLGRAPKRRCIHVYNEEEDIDIVGLADHTRPSDGGSSDAVSQSRPQFRMSYPHRSTARAELNLVIDVEAKAATKTEASDDAANILSNAAASRFHITARVRVEDRSLYLTKERQAQLGCPHQYRWMVAVTAPSYALPVVSYLTRVTISTPPAVSAVPLSVDKQPFAVVGSADNPFLAKLLLEWVGGGRLEMERWVDLDPSKSSTSVLGFDEMIDIELDRNTPLLPTPNGNPPSLPSLDRVVSGLDASAYPVSGSSAMVGQSDQPYERTLRSLLPKVPMTAKGRRPVMILKYLGAYLPSDVKARSAVRVPYKLVASPAHLLALLPGRRKAIEWARARTLQALYTEQMASSPLHHVQLTVGDVYAWLEDASLFPRLVSSMTPPLEVKKRGKDKDKEGTPLIGDLPCAVCGVKRRLHPEYDIKPEDGIHEWTCSIVSPVDRARHSKLPFANLGVIFSRNELERALCNSLPRPKDGNDVHDGQLSPATLPTFQYTPRAVIALSSPELILAVHRCAGKIHLPHIPGPLLESDHRGFLAPRATVENNIAPAALLAAILKPFVSTLIRPALEVAKHDVLVVTNANTLTSSSKSGRASRTKKVPFVLTPSHVLRGLQSSFTRHGAGLSSRDARSVTTREAVALCLARVGLPYNFGYPLQHSSRPASAQGSTEREPVKGEQA
ncbi:hypothetical protein ID866_7158 [Astraeus odoratus]|nr:hypothetical protein ID866_7158 [Astraeus odoratus]